MAFDGGRVDRGRLYAVTFTTGALVAGVVGWLVIRGDSSSEFVPWPEAGGPIDAAIDARLIDAAIDAPPDAPPDAAPGTIDPNVAWTRHTIYNGLSGADGVDLADVDGDGDMDIATAWEEGQAVTISIRPSTNFDSPWQTFIVGSNLPGLEDAKFGDIDGDGKLDVVSATEGGQKVSIHFAPTSATYTDPANWTTVTISTNFQRWNQIALADMNADGKLDIVAGGRRDTTGCPTPAAKIGIFYGPASSPRTAGSWSFTSIRDAGWTMTLRADDVDGDGDKDLLITDRLHIFGTCPTKDSSLTDASWMEQGPIGTFTHRNIALPAGDVRFLDYDGSRICDGYTNSPNAHLYTHAKPSPATGTWTATQLTDPTNFGQFQACEFGDLTGDGVVDMVITASQTFSPNSGVLWLKGPTFSQRGEVSGNCSTCGEKWDNIALYDVDGDGDKDIISTEQNTGLGLVWYANPTF